VNVESLRDAQVEGFDILERVRRQLVGAAGDDEFTKLQRKAAEYISFVQACDAPLIFYKYFLLTSSIAMMPKDQKSSHPRGMMRTRGGLRSKKSRMLLI
jgi:hypothetical protein